MGVPELRSPPCRRARAGQGAATMGQLGDCLVPRGLLHAAVGCPPPIFSPGGPDGVGGRHDAS
eukprot:1717314-Alexandrium_andersonii.AAC.1